MKVKSYSDCSFVDNEYGAYGIYIITDTGEDWHTSGTVPKEVKDSFTGEMYGIYASLYHSIKVFNPDSIELICDSVGALDRFRGWEEKGYTGKSSRYSEMRIRLIEHFWYYAQNKDVTFTWVEGHQSATKTDFNGKVNIFCDALAKTHRCRDEMSAIDVTDLFA
jgi:ribonuclease HI